VEQQGSVADLGSAAGAMDLPEEIQTSTRLGSGLGGNGGGGVKDENVDGLF
jgi:hypothetical protein